MGLRRLLNRQASAQRPTEPLARLVELGRAEEGVATSATPTGPFAQLRTQGEAGPTRLVRFDKTAELVESAAEVSTADSKTQVESPRSRSGYMWVSERSRSRRAAWADFVDRTF
jgi:hypothetical protein